MAVTKFQPFIVHAWCYWAFEKLLEPKKQAKDVIICQLWDGFQYSLLATRQKGYSNMSEWLLIKQMMVNVERSNQCPQQNFSYKQKRKFCSSKLFRYSQLTVKWDIYFHNLYYAAHLISLTSVPVCLNILHCTFLFSFLFFSSSSTAAFKVKDNLLCANPNHQRWLHQNVLLKVTLTNYLHLSTMYLKLYAPFHPKIEY